MKNTKWLKWRKKNWLPFLPHSLFSFCPIRSIKIIITKDAKKRRNISLMQTLSSSLTRSTAWSSAHPHLLYWEKKMAIFRSELMISYRKKKRTKATTLHSTEPSPPGQSIMEPTEPPPPHWCIMEPTEPSAPHQHCHRAPKVPFNSLSLFRSLAHTESNNYSIRSSNNLSMYYVWLVWTSTSIMLIYLHHL